MVTIDMMTLDDQLAVLRELCQPPTWQRFASPRQLVKLNIALREIVGEDWRIAVLREALGYTTTDELGVHTFTSSKQMYFSDARGLIDWLWEDGDSPVTLPTKRESVMALRMLKIQIEQRAYEQVLA